MKLKRIISGFLAACMLFLMLPTVAFAEGGAGQDDGINFVKKEY